MKKLILGLIAAVLFSASGFAFNNKAVTEKELNESTTNFAEKSHLPSVVFNRYICWETVTVTLTVSGSLTFDVGLVSTTVTAEVSLSGSRTVECIKANATRTQLSNQIGQGAAETLANKLQSLKNAALAAFEVP